MNNRKLGIYIITGPPGVGKSTVAGRLANRLESSAYIEGDTLYHMVVGGYVSPWKNNDLYLELFWDNVVDITNNFMSRNISVVLEYIIFPDEVDNIVKRIARNDIEINYVVLMADKNTIIERDQLREPGCRMGEKALKVFDKFKNADIKGRFILDTSNLSEEETLKIIIEEKRFFI